MHRWRERRRAPPDAPTRAARARLWYGGGVRATSLLATGVLLASSVAAQRQPVPDPGQQAAFQERLLEAVAAETGREGPAKPGVAVRLITRAAASGEPVLRFGLLKQAMRCALVAGDVDAGLRAADALAAAFVVAAPHDRFLADLEASGHAPAQALAAGHLAVALRALGDAGDDGERSLAHAERVAASDDPIGLREAVAARCDALRSLAADVRARRPDTGPRVALRQRSWFGEQSGPMAPEGPDSTALARDGERELALCVRETDVVVQRERRRRAIALMQPFARRSTDDPDERAEITRVRRLIDQSAALAVEPGVGALRFASERDLGRMCITGGAWWIAEGELRGRSLGPEVATRATSRFSWRTIDTVTIRGGIRSVDGLNLRIAVGPVNVLLNWECADQNHAYYGDTRLEPRSPRALQAGREHTIVVRQCGEDAVVAVDGDVLFSAPATLAGTICVYPAIGSEIFVRSIDIVGDVDLAAVVAGPGAAR